MAPRRFLPVFLVSLMLLAFSSSASAASDKVDLSLYYETLCPGCSQFIVKDLPKLFTTGLIDIVNLHLVPYGNAKKQGSQIICQHGPDECLLNRVEACAITFYANPRQYWPFLDCVEDLVVRREYKDFERCFDQTGLSSEVIQTCYESEIGNMIIEQYGNETESLNPPHEYVPWVVVNGAPLHEKLEDYLKFVCEAYKGTPKPKSCQDLLRHLTVLKAEDHSVQHVCPASRNVPPSTS